MPDSLRQQLAESLVAVRGVFRNPSLRRIQLAWGGSIVGQYANMVAISVYAYRHNGAAAVGLLLLARMIPAAIVSPFAAMLGDRVRRDAVMVGADLGRVATTGLSAAVMFLHGPALAVYALAVATSIVGTLFHPAQAALLPQLAETPEELTASNVSASTIESVGSFAGPAVGGLLLAVASPGAVFAFTAVCFLWSASLVARLGPRARRPSEAAAAARPHGFRGEALAGFRTIARAPRLRVVVGLYSAQTVVAGAASVLVVVAAIRLLALGNAGVGYLNSASGIGGVVGAAVALALVARHRLAGEFGAGIVLWGLPLLLLGVFPSTAMALVMLGFLGVGNTLVDVSALTLLQRSVDDEVLTRVFGVIESMLVATIGLGAALAPLVVALAGIRTALVVFGALLPLLAALSWTRLAEIDRDAQVPARQLELLRGSPIFAPLPASTLERLAWALRPVAVEAGTEVVRAGEAGDDFYLVDEGEAEVLGRTLGPGEGFGEIALLRDVPRTATVRAVTPLRLYALDRERFVAAVTGFAPSRTAADAVIAGRLATPRPGVAAV
jgi:predicted MFS family arabinose efflux permease